MARSLFYLFVKTNIKDWGTVTEDELIAQARRKFSMAKFSHFATFIQEWNRILKVSYQESRKRLVDRAKQYNAGLNLPVVRSGSEQPYCLDEEEVWLLSTDDDDYFHPSLADFLLDLEEKGKLNSQTIWWHQWTCGDEHVPYNLGKLIYGGRFMSNHLEIKGKTAKTKRLQCVQKDVSYKDSLSFAMKSPWSLSYYKCSLPRDIEPNGSRSSYWQTLTWGQKIVRLHQLFIRNAEADLNKVPNDVWWKSHWEFTLSLCKEALGDLVEVKVTPDLEL